MCTVTFIARRNGYALGMNRDEKLARVTALPPARHRLGSGDVLFPSEPNGGTWIGVNDTGTAFALINWYSITSRVAGRAVSRGEVVKLALASATSADVDAALATLSLACVNPFRLVGVFPACKAVVEWRWNLNRLQRLDHAWRTNTWSSSVSQAADAEPETERSSARIAPRAGRARWQIWRKLHAPHASCAPARFVPSVRGSRRPAPAPPRRNGNCANSRP